MKCPSCQHEHLPQAKFCQECGARLTLACTKCGSEIAPSAKFCPECGDPIVPAGAQVQFGSLQSYTPKHLAEKILISKAALEGERKHVTVLFADLKGSMELLSDRDPEEARKILDPLLEHMMEAVHRYEGTVNQVMGDGIMALFGAPLAHEDHAVRACYAALRMQESVKRYADEVVRVTRTPVQIRVGLNSGEVVVRSIGSDLHMDYTAVGQTTQLAARMEQIASPGSILLTAKTLRLVEGFVRATAHGPVRIKGLGDPVEVFELVGVGAMRTRLQAAAAHGLTPFVGRGGELAQLRGVVQQAAAGHGQLVAIIGEPGIGKSRLAYEFTQSLTGDWLVLETSAASYGKPVPYLPLIDCLKAYFGIEARDDERTMREKIAGKVLTLDRALEPTLPAFAALLDVPVDDSHWQALDPPQRRRRTLEAVKQLLLRESAIRPLCLVLENLHWIDSETQAFLDSLIESLPTARFLLLVSYRSEYRHGWGSKTYYTQLRIDSLGLASADEFLAALMGHDPALGTLKRLLIDRTEGNPFFLEESVRTLVETDVLRGEPRDYHVAKPLTSIQVPATVQSVLAVRIDRLPPEDKRLLQAASVIGRDVPLALLEGITDLPDEERRRGLSRLQAAEFLYETRLFPDPEYTFKHALTQEVAYGGLLHERRKSLHARVVEGIERLYSGRLAEHAETLAQHALRSESWEKAVTYLRQAGAKATARSAHREAGAHFSQAVVALKRVPESRQTREVAIDLRCDLRNSLLLLGEFQRTFEYLREAETLAESLHDERRLTDVSANLTHYFRLVGDPERAIASGQRALALAETLGDFTLLLKTQLVLGQAYLALGDYPRAVDFFRRCMASVEGDRSHERFGQPAFPSVTSRAYLIWSLAEIGQFAEGILHGEDVIRIAHSVEHPYSLVLACSAFGGLRLRKGDLDGAIPVLEQGVGLCEAWNIPFQFPTVASQLGYAYALSGRVSEGLLLLERAVEQSDGMGFMFGRSLYVAWLSEAYLLARRSEDARRRAVDLHGHDKERGHHAYALRVLGEIAARENPLATETAEGYYQQALALARTLGMRPLVAQCHLDLGTLFRSAGQQQRAREHFATATTMLEEMEMGFWLKQAHAELAALR